MEIKVPRSTRVLSTRKWWSWVVVVLVLGVIGNPIPVNAKESDATAYTKQVKAKLDITALEQLLVQMPETIQPEMKRNGEERTFTWTFSDGSQLLMVFRPAGGEGSGQGLVLYMVDIIE